MKNKILILLSLLTQITMGQKMENSFYTWDDFAKNFGKEMVSAEDVYNNMKKSGMPDYNLCTFDFVFVSDQKGKLEKLKELLQQNYGCKVKGLDKVDGNWELSGDAQPFPVTLENLMYWALDMAKRGYEFDSYLDGYGAPFDPKKPNQVTYRKEKEEQYFQNGIAAYQSGNLSSAIAYWNAVVDVNSKNSDAYYSRAIVKNELFTWKAALRDYDKAIEISPDFIGAILNRGSLKDENGDYEGAIQDYDTVIKSTGPDSDDLQMAYFNKGNTLFNMNDKESACVNWHKAKELGADYADERINELCK